MYWTDESWVEPMFDFYFGMEFKFYEGNDHLGQAAEMSDQLRAMAYSLLAGTRQLGQFACQVPECGDVDCGGFFVHRLWGNQMGFVLLCSGGQHPYKHPVLCTIEIAPPGT